VHAAIPVTPALQPLRQWRVPTREPSFSTAVSAAELFAPPPPASADARVLAAAMAAVAAPRLAPPLLPESQAPVHVLVVEDEFTNQRLLQRMLQRLGVSCDIVEDGEQCEALLVAAGHLPAASDADAGAPGGTPGSSPSGRFQLFPSADASLRSVSAAGRLPRPSGLASAHQAAATGAAGPSPDRKRRLASSSDEGTGTPSTPAVAAALAAAAAPAAAAGASGGAAPRLPYVCVLMDINLARGSCGDLVTARLRARGLRIPVFPMTANVSDAERARYCAAGMESTVLAKPFTREELRLVLQGLSPAVGSGGISSST
jgi:CheY-like chemotaxis protein